jgi:hypothetical protein
MEQLSDPSKVGEGIAVAFVATVYPTFESPMTEPMIFYSRGPVSQCYPLALGAPYCGWIRWRGGADATPNLPNP